MTQKEIHTQEKEPALFEEKKEPSKDKSGGVE